MDSVEFRDITLETFGSSVVSPGAVLNNRAQRSRHFFNSYGSGFGFISQTTSTVISLRCFRALIATLSVGEDNLVISYRKTVY